MTEKEYYDNLTFERKIFLENFSTVIKNELERQKITNDDDCKKKSNLNFEEKGFINTFSIDASWGMGKTFFAKALKYYLENELTINVNEEPKKIKVLNYNAWQNDYFDDPMKTIIGELNSQKILNSDIKEKADKLIKNSSIKLLKFFGQAIANKAGIDKTMQADLLDIFGDIRTSNLDEYNEYKKLLNDFKTALRSQAIIGESYKPKVIIVDELDRCRPNFSIEVLEAIKHIFDIENIIFVFFINKTQLEKSVHNMYGEIEKSESYLKKFFDLEFNLPKIQFNEFINQFYKEHANTDYWFADNTINYEKFYENLFLLMFKEFNLDVTVREFKKLFNKYQILLNTLKDYEKESFPLVILLTGYFLLIEIDKKVDSNVLSNKIFSTFFKLLDRKIGGEFYNIYGGEYTRINYEIFGSNLNEMIANLSTYIGTPFYEDSYSGFTNRKFKGVLSMECRKDKTLFHVKNNCNSCLERRECPLDGKSGRLIEFSDNTYKINNLFSGSLYQTGTELYLPISADFIDKMYKNEINPLIKWCELKYSFILQLSK